MATGSHVGVNSEDLTEKYQQCQQGALEKTHAEGTWERASRAQSRHKEIALSRHLATLYFTNMFNHRKWVKKVFPGELSILIEKNFALLLKFWIILFFF